MRPLSPCIIIFWDRAALFEISTIAGAGEERKKINQQVNQQKSPHAFSSDFATERLLILMDILLSCLIHTWNITEEGNNWRLQSKKGIRTKKMTITLMSRSTLQRLAAANSVKGYIVLGDGWKPKAKLSIERLYRIPLDSATRNWKYNEQLI